MLILQRYGIAGLFVAMIPYHSLALVRDNRIGIDDDRILALVAPGQSARTIRLVSFKLPLGRPPNFEPDLQVKRLLSQSLHIYDRAIGIHPYAEQLLVFAFACDNLDLAGLKFKRLAK